MPPYGRRIIAGRVSYGASKSLIPKVKLGENGPTVSRLALGLKGLAERGSSFKRFSEWVHQCLEMGYSLVELADIYGGYRCEGVFGELLAKEPDIRKDIQIISKCGIKLPHRNRPQYTVAHFDSSLMHIISSVDHSLEQLNTDYLDILLLHRFDPLMDAAEVAEAFTELKQTGKVLHFGVCKFLPRQFELLQNFLVEPLVTNQVELSLGCLDPVHNGMVDLAHRVGSGLLANVPLAQGRFTTPDDDHFLNLVEVMSKVQEECGANTIEAVAIAWLIRLPIPVIPVIRSARIKRLEAAAEGARLELSREQWFVLNEAALGHPVDY